MTQVFYHLRPRCVGGPRPPPVIPQQLGSKSQKRVPSVTLTPLSLSSPVLYYRWYLGWHFNTHVKKVKSSLEGCRSPTVTLCFSQTEEQREKRQVTSPLLSDNTQTPATKMDPTVSSARFSAHSFPSALVCV